MIKQVHLNVIHVSNYSSTRAFGVWCSFQRSPSFRTGGTLRPWSLFALFKWTYGNQCRQLNCNHYLFLICLRCRSTHLDWCDWRHICSYRLPTHHLAAEFLKFNLFYLWTVIRDAIKVVLLKLWSLSLVYHVIQTYIHPLKVKWPILIKSLLSHQWCNSTDSRIGSKVSSQGGRQGQLWLGANWGINIVRWDWRQQNVLMKRATVTGLISVMQ